MVEIVCGLNLGVPDQGTELGRLRCHQAFLKCQISMDSSVLSLLIIEINVLDRISQCKLICSVILFLFMHLMRENIFLGVRDIPCNY